MNRERTLVGETERGNKLFLSRKRPRLKCSLPHSHGEPEFDGDKHLTVVALPTSLRRQ